MLLLYYNHQYSINFCWPCIEWITLVLTF